MLNAVESQQKIYLSRFISNELSHFVQNNSGRIAFTNKRIANFFSKEDNTENDFYVLQQNGHNILSQYWLRCFEEHPNKTSLTMIVDLFKHVTFSKNQSLIDRLVDIIHTNLNSTTKTFLTHYIAASLNSYDAMLLAIGLTSKMNIDIRDQGNLTSSYLAAAYGNDKSLAALLRKGADIQFQRSQPLFREISPNHDPIHLSKYTFQWGYNLANIASQNGHDRVIELLLNHNINISHENSVGLNSFHLASEHGHTSILKLLMTSSQCNWNSSFQLSLYLAAKNGHLNVVKYLLSLGVTDRCVPCSDSINWIPNGKARWQSSSLQQKLPYEIDYRNFVLKDDRHLYFCESALDIAVQNNHLEVVKFLIREPINALKCLNAQGMTPLITAVVLREHDILHYFLTTGLSLNDTCRVRKKMKTRFHNFKNTHHSDEPLCVKGLSFWHMLAIYSSEKTIEFVYQKKLNDYLWNVTDDYGATPFHYACCNERVNHISTFYMIASHKYNRTLNGSTPAHSAALCGQYVPMSLFF